MGTDLVMQFWDELASVAKRDGVEPYKLDHNWRVSFGKWAVVLNASKEERDGLPGQHTAIEYGGTPLGILNPGGGTVAGHDMGALKDCIAAMREEFSRLATVMGVGRG
jgi:hypothetical protein